MRTFSGVIVSMGLALVLAVGIRAAGSPNPPKLVFNHAVGPFWIGETDSRVQYDWGLGKDGGGCVLMDEVNGGPGGCASGPGSFTSQYTVTGGYVRLAFYKHHLVDIETNSPYYRTKDGIGVGAQISYAKPKVMDGVRFRYFTPYCGCWWGWSKVVPYPRKAKDGSPTVKRWLRAESHIGTTILTVDKGRVVYLYVARGDVNFQF